MDEKIEADADLRRARKAADPHHPSEFPFKWHLVKDTFSVVLRDGLYRPVNPVRRGIWSDYPFTGEIQEGEWQGAIKKGKKEGPWVQYYDDGRDQERRETVTVIPNTGQIYRKTEYKKGRPNGPEIFYFENGQLRFEGVNKDGLRHGAAVRYHSNGQVAHKGAYWKDEKEKVWEGYSPRGKLMYKGAYSLDRATMVAWGRDGPWVFFKEDGTEHVGNEAVYDEFEKGWHSGSGTYRNGEKVSD